MDVTAFIRQLGKTACDRELLDVFRENKISMFSFPDNEFHPYSAHIECKPLGMGFGFEAYSPHEVNSSESEYLKNFYFNAIFLYANCKDGYSQFSGKLPNDLSFLLSRNDLIERCGNPRFSRNNSKDNTIIALDVWDFSEHSISINYQKENSKISLISFFPKKKSSFSV